MLVIASHIMMLHNEIVYSLDDADEDEYTNEPDSGFDADDEKKEEDEDDGTETDSFEGDEGVD